MPRRVLAIIQRGQPIRALYEDGFPYHQVGEAQISRASHVEPVPGTCPFQWQADCSPVGGPLLGPFTTRQAALDAEVAWLVANNIPFPQPAASETQRAP